jgi:rod shape-determining protein MreC
MSRHRRTILFLLMLLAVLALLTGQVRGEDRRRLGPLGTGILTVLAPLQTAMARVADSVARGWQLYTEIGRLRLENVRLREEIQRLTREVTRLRETAQAAQRLETLLAFKEQIPYRVVAARVVGRDPTSWFATLVVDRGGTDGVVRNSAVVTAEGAVGRVLETTPFTARLLLISDPRSAVSVILQRSREIGVVEGNGPGDLEVKYLSRASAVQPGDAVITSGQGGVFPRGIVVGRLTAVRPAVGAAVFREGAVRPAVDLGRLEEVLILVPEGGPRH